MGKCKFQNQWLNQTDLLGFKISTWCRKQTLTDEEAFCTVCCVAFKVTKGFQSITQHVNTSKHAKNVTDKQGPRQTHMTLPLTTEQPITPPEKENPSGPLRSSTSGVIRLYSVRDSAATAELIWAMKNVICNMSAASCFGIANTFQAMFPNCIPDGFCLSPAKLGYLITDALGPYFRKKMVEDAQNSLSYSLLFDETTNNEGKKELQSCIRHWSEAEDEVVTRHLETFFLGHATGKDLVKYLCTALTNANLSMNRLLMIGSDGPNVNKTVVRLLNEEVKKSATGPHCNGLLDIGFCNIHVVHNAFLKGLVAIGADVSDFIISIYYFFNGRPARWEDYTKIQEELKIKRHKFIKHVSSRWLTIDEAGNRVLEQWDAVSKFFLKFIPEKQENLMSNANYVKVVKCLKLPSFKAEIHFVVYSAHTFTRFTRFFQRQEPLIHILYDELKSLVQVLIARVCKADVVKKNNLLEEDASTIFAAKNLLPVCNVVVSDEVSSFLKNLIEKDRIHFMSRVQKHYIDSCSHILKKTPLCRVVKHFRFLKPSQRTTYTSCNDIISVAQCLPFEKPIEIDVLQDEWRLLQLEEGDFPSTTPDGQRLRIDHYWRNFFNIKNINNGQKYPTVAKVVKASLSLSHGSADVERGFSKSGRVITKDKTNMSVRTLNARLIISDCLKTYEDKPELVPITMELLTLARGAHASYHAHLENEQLAKKRKDEADEAEKKRILKEKERIRELQTKKESIEQLEQDLNKTRGEHSDKRTTAAKLFSEANIKRKKGLQKNDLTEVRVAQAMLDSAQSVQEEANLKRKHSDILEQQIKKRKDELLSTALKRSSNYKERF